MNAHKMPGGGHSSKPTIEKLNNRLGEKFGVAGKYVAGISDCRIYLDHEAIANNRLDLKEVKRATVDVLREDPQFAFAIDYDDISNATIPQFLRERIINGYHRLRSGDLMIRHRRARLQRHLPRHMEPRRLAHPPALHGMERENRQHQQTDLHDRHRRHRLCDAAHPDARLLYRQCHTGGVEIENGNPHPEWMGIFLFLYVALATQHTGRRGRDYWGNWVKVR